MKKTYWLLIISFIVVGCVEKPEEFQDLSPQNKSFESLNVVSGFNFKSAVEKNLKISLGEGFSYETVSIQLRFIDRDKSVLVHQGFSSLENTFALDLSIPNHFESIQVIARMNGLQYTQEMQKEAMGDVILNKNDFTEIPSTQGAVNPNYQYQSESTFVYCETDNPNGDVQIVSRVLVIKGSNKEDELDVDKNGTSTSVILKTDGTTRVDTDYDNSLFDCIFVYLGEDDDIVQMGSTEKPSLINLGNGKDEITASDQAKDIIYGGNGKDKIIGKYATDELIGGEGVDDIDNGSGGTITQDGAEENCTPICGSVDADGDGVNSDADVDDNDPDVSQYNYPQGYDVNSNAYVYHSLVYEDLWPCQGDYDFNDLIVYYSFRENQNAAGLTTSLEFNTKFPAMGGSFDNTACIRVVDGSNTAVLSANNISTLPGAIGVTRTHDAVNSTTSFCFSNLKSIYGEQGNTVVNTESKVYSEYPIMTGSITGFNTGTDVYDQYMLIDNDITKQVHDMASDNPNSALNIATSDAIGFNSCDDDSANQAKQYVNSNGLPWALSIPAEWGWPKEKVDMLEAYPDFDDFIVNPALDWYSDANDNKVDSKIIN